MFFWPFKGTVAQDSPEIFPHENNLISTVPYLGKIKTICKTTVLKLDGLESLTRGKKGSDTVPLTEIHYTIYRKILISSHFFQAILYRCGPPL